MKVDFLRRARVVASYLASHLARRDPNVWIFGSIHGFRDNPRYLAEHVLGAHPEIQVWWLARTEDEVTAARQAGLSVTTPGATGTAVQRRAGAAFISHGFVDLEPAHLGGAFIVDLKHGQGTKRILLDMPDPDADSPSRLVRAGARVRRWYIRRRLAAIDMVVAPGELEQSRYVTAYGLPPSQIPVLGTPRFDVIRGGEAYRRVTKGDLRQQLGLAPDERVILWLPTWREEGDGWIPRLDGDVVERGLDATRGVFLVKPHPYSDSALFASALSDHPQVRILSDSTVDVNCLLRIADALVTDYSSAVFDYALLERPIHFFAPDIELYRHGEGLQPEFAGLLGGRVHRDWARLFAAVREGLQDGDASVARRIRAESRNYDEPGSCERITLAVASAVGSTRRPRE